MKSNKNIDFRVQQFKFQKDMVAKELVLVRAMDPAMPEMLEDALGDLSAQFDLEKDSVIPPALSTGGGTLGKGALLETGIFPAPLNASLDCLLLDDDSVADSFVQVLAQPIRERQDEQIASLGSMCIKDLRAKIHREEEDCETFFAHVKIRDPEAVASFDEKKQRYEQLLHPLLLVENVAPGLLHEAVFRNGGLGLLDLESELAIRSLLKTRKKARNDFELRTRAFFNKTHEAALFGTQQKVMPVKPAISCLMVCNQPLLASLLCSQDTAVRQFCDLLIICRPQRAGNTTANGSASVPDSWRALIANLFLQRSGESRLLSLAPEARVELLKYCQECNSPYESTRLGRLAPIIAGKVALILQVFGGPDMTNEISREVMIIAIFLTRKIIAETAAAANQCIAADQLSERATKMTRILQKICTSGQISERELQRSANLKIDELRSIIDELVLQGEVHYSQEGMIEASQTSKAYHEVNASPRSDSPAAGR